jgi:hypothetical protein
MLNTKCKGSTITSCLEMIVTFAVTMRLSIIIVLVLLAVSCRAQTSMPQPQNDSLMYNFIELNGVVMSADSLQYVPYCSVTSARGVSTYASDMGVFSIVVQKGDTLHFTSPGYRTIDYAIAENLAGLRYSIIQLMVQDTFFLAETILRPAPTREKFDYAFKYWEIPDDRYELARKNTEEQAMRILSSQLKRDGRENQEAYKRMLIDRQSWVGQQPPQRIFSPLAWADFIAAWKRGDFKKRSKKRP